MRRARRWDGLDAAILLVTFLVAVAVVWRQDHEVCEDYRSNYKEAIARNWPEWCRPVVEATWRLKGDLASALVVATLGLSLLAVRRRFVPPRGRWPGRGKAALAASALALGVAASSLAIDAIAEPNSVFVGLANPHWFSYAISRYETSSKQAVIGAWTLLALAGRWRWRGREGADAVERSGRVLGWCWLASLAFDLFRLAAW